MPLPSPGWHYRDHLEASKAPTMLCHVFPSRMRPGIAFLRQPFMAVLTIKPEKKKWEKAASPRHKNLQLLESGGKTIYAIRRNMPTPASLVWVISPLRAKRAFICRLCIGRGETEKGGSWAIKLTFTSMVDGFVCTAFADPLSMFWLRP